MRTDLAVDPLSAVRRYPAPEPSFVIATIVVDRGIDFGQEDSATIALPG